MDMWLWILLFEVRGKRPLYLPKFLWINTAQGFVNRNSCIDSESSIYNSCV